MAAEDESSSSSSAPPPPQQQETLRTLWSKAESARAALDTAPNALSQTYADTLGAALASYRRARDLAAAASLFSPNEALDDVATRDLPLLLAEYRVAELLQRTPRLGAAEKLRVLGEARASYEGFLALADAYGLLPPGGDAAKMLERYGEGRESFSVAAASVDAAARRDAKIADFRRGKEIADKLAYLRANPRYVNDGEDNEDGKGGGGGGGDEELVREVYLLDAAAAVHGTFQALDTMNREIEILAMAPDIRGQGGDREHQHGQDRRTEAPDESLRIEHPSARAAAGHRGGPILSKTGKPLQPFTLLPSRSHMARSVFRPGHNLPTMSVDEYLEEERRRGGIIEGTGDEPRPPPDEDDMELADRETYKAREWDEFKDHNPRGAGNTLNKG
ncbi:hypothetical protein N3K66_001989 [Trichothecium roseum]|uniref:Uncharacterized protein n=1 Tax=Trichothecium roseum TaxID=47278 RepID=A0ACC0V8A9_9HYPO|nr:hypothetical protein N3K66_001989 [Trichothecium roseum]